MALKRAIAAETKAHLPHPKGFISANLRLEGSRMRGVITLPAGITGIFRQGGRKKPLHPGRNTISPR